MHEMARTHLYPIDEVVDRAGRDALDLGLLDRGALNLLGQCAAARESLKVAARFLSFGMRSSIMPARISQSCSRYSLRCASHSRLFQPKPAGKAAAPHRHQALRGKADHLSQKIGVGALFSNNPRNATTLRPIVTGASKRLAV